MLAERGILEDIRSSMAAKAKFPKRRRLQRYFFFIESTPRVSIGLFFASYRE